MSRVSAAFKREFLYQLKKAAVDGGVTFISALDTVASQRWSEVQQGKVLVGSSRSGHSVNFQIPGGVLGVSPVDIVELVSKIRDLYEAALAADTALLDDSPEAANVLAIYAAIKADTYFTPIRSYRTDHTNLRLEGAVRV